MAFLPFHVSVSIFTPASASRVQAIERTLDERAAFDREHASAFPAIDNAANIASVVHLFNERRMHR